MECQCVTGRDANAAYRNGKLMLKFSIVQRADWDAFVASVPPDVLGFQQRETSRLPGMVLVCLNEKTWALAKATGKFMAMPPPWASVKRLSPEVRALIGKPAADADTVGDAIQDLAGKNIFTD